MEGIQAVTPSQTVLSSTPDCRGEDPENGEALPENFERRESKWETVLLLVVPLGWLNIAGHARPWRLCHRA